MIPALMPTYAPGDVVFEKGEGVYLYDVDGKRYLDFAAGIAVSSLGHCHPHLVAALHAQVDKLWHLSNMYRIPTQERLAQRLVDASFADSVFFTNSGAEAVECGLKMIRKYHDDAGNPEKYRVIACRNAFHGRTLATIAAGGQEKHLQGFAPAMDGFDHVAFGNLNELRAAITPQTAAILVEPVQGEGGLRAADPEYLKRLRSVADEFGLLLMFDEVQCGMGRTGKLFAHEWADIRPDIVATAKGIGGGFPLGACLATEKAAVLGVGNHGTTYGGNPLATTVGNAVLDVILEDGFLGHVVEVGGALKAGLDDLARRFPQVFVESRGQGLMLGLKCAPGVENRDLKKTLEDAGLLVAPAGENVLRFLPPLIIEQAHVEEALGILAAVAARQAS
ncbi:aspartate aminotransferase family protein [Varunaivibrio sulfuroxidans]|uniref:Acetylornithine aminotransferase n=1 Tax=Varunaivibrio sulfuroxidans TaxID=1773489 RepID=A0A4R3JGD6_9PROT|nr:aspartate aminotransferase family protein [Varunaivibrio sulfuroxidans]TCS64972.1 acetylornithine aminotransferase [Varunaivibrio sulfuroxidans]WES29736.1 aspartate aminotransferase family protein [Varunaivibrio sulfuroxidans]